MERIVIEVFGSDVGGWGVDVDGVELPFRARSRAGAGRLAARELGQRDVSFEQRRARALAQYGMALAAEDPRRAA
jgi:hypothetical protein